MAAYLSIVTKTSWFRDAAETLRLELGGDVQSHPGDSHEHNFTPRVRHLRKRRWPRRRLGTCASLLFACQPAAGFYPWRPVRRCR
ncbi:hypothetical protein MESS4_250001 [Mesorhizobium sp. STM 4661]|nr:hypothetical protein MESS4_250001 [Mesorhizobium sp. STM 4661]